MGSQISSVLDTERARAGLEDIRSSLPKPWYFGSFDCIRAGFFGLDDAERLEAVGAALRWLPTASSAEGRVSIFRLLERAGDEYASGIGDRLLEWLDTWGAEHNFVRCSILEALGSFPSIAPRSIPRLLEERLACVRQAEGDRDARSGMSAVAASMALVELLEQQDSGVTQETRDALLAEDNSLVADWELSLFEAVPALYRDLRFDSPVEQRLLASPRIVYDVCRHCPADVVRHVVGAIPLVGRNLTWFQVLSILVDRGDVTLSRERLAALCAHEDSSVRLLAIQSLSNLREPTSPEAPPQSCKPRLR